MGASKLTRTFPQAVGCRCCWQRLPPFENRVTFKLLLAGTTTQCEDNKQNGGTAHQVGMAHQGDARRAGIQAVIVIAGLIRGDQSMLRRFGSSQKQSTREKEITILMFSESVKWWNFLLISSHDVSSEKTALHRQEASGRHLGVNGGPDVMGNERLSAGNWAEAKEVYC